MNTKSQIGLLLVFVSLATLIIGSAPMVNAAPVTSDYLCQVFADPTTESWALDTGDIDINDWPLTKDFITRWADRLDITMQEYAEIGKMEFDINNQWWPTGPEDPTHSQAGARNVPYDETKPRHVAALHFRRAIAHLTDRDDYITQQGGQAYAMLTEVPVPALAGYTDYKTLYNGTANAARSDNPYVYNNPDITKRGFMYPHDALAAAKELELGGFVKVGGVYKWDNPATPPGDYEDLPNMKFWIRIDDPNRRYAGEQLYNEMVALGIPAAAGADAPGLEKIITERSACFTAVMVQFKYNIYTGGWSLSADLDGTIYDLYHSSMGQYSWCTNYAGFKNAEFDVIAEKVKKAASAAEVRPAAINAQWIKAKYMPVVELWAAKAVKAYRTGWSDVVNMAGYGINNAYSYYGMKWTDPDGTGTTYWRNGPEDTIKMGFKSDVSQIHIISSEWVWDWQALGLIYDSLIARNPYDLSEEVGFMASEWGTTVSYPGWEGKTVAEYKLRTDLYFHDGSAVTPMDVVESLLLLKSAGSGVAWNYPAVMDIDHVQVSGQIIRVFFNVQSFWALHWAGFMPIFKADIWKTGINAMGAGYSGVVETPSGSGIYYPGTFTNAMKVRDYRPWEMDKYPGGVGNGKLDLNEDGSYMYVFDSYVTGGPIAFHAFKKPNPENKEFYDEIYDLSKGGWVRMTDGTYSHIPAGTYYKLPILWKMHLFFHRSGNTNYAEGWGTNATPDPWYAADRYIDYDDRFRTTRSIPANYADKWGPGDAQFNPDTDFTGDKIVDIEDKVIVNQNYLKQAG